jgi:signal transduction histidine kinase
MKLRRRLILRLLSTFLDPTAQADPIYAKKIGVFNRIAFIFAAVSFPYIFVFSYFGLSPYNWGVLALCSSYWFAIWLNQKNHFNSRFIFVTASNIGIFVFSTGLGRVTGIHFLYFTAIISPFVIYKLREKWSLIYGTLLPFAFLLLLWETDWFGRVPYPVSVQIMIFKFVFPATLFFCLCFLYYLTSENDLAETKLQKNVEQLVASERRNMSLLRAIPDLILRMKWDGTVIDCYFNTQGGFTVPSSYFSGMKISQMFPDCHEKILYELKMTLHHQRLNSFEFETLNAGQSKFFEARMININNDEVMSIIRDITNEKKNQRDFAEQQMKLMASSKMSALGEMAGGIAHEINNPLAIIHGYSGLLKKLCEKETIDKPQISRLSERIVDTVDRIARIVRAMRTFSRDGSLDVIEKVDLRSVIEDVLELSRENLKREDVELKLPKMGSPIVVECRRVQISQVLLNLLSNAKDAVMDVKDKSMKKWIAIGLIDDGDDILLSVSDSGPGVPTALKDKIFQPFFTTKEQGKGTGLGLGISRGIIEQHHGTLELDTDPRSRITRFTIRLPKNQPMPSASEDATQAA